MTLAVCLLSGVMALVQTNRLRTPYTNVRWQTFVASYFLALAAVAAVGLLSKPRLEVAALGAVSGGTTAAGFLFIFSVGILVLVAAVPLWLAAARAARQPREWALAMACGGVVGLVPFVGMLTLYHA
jgi:hypothetical protein